MAKILSNPVLRQKGGMEAELTVFPPDGYDVTLAFLGQ